MVRGDESVAVVKYFSAYAKWRETSYRRHQRYVHQLENAGVRFVEGKFKGIERWCKLCRRYYDAREEKETECKYWGTPTGRCLQGQVRSGINSIF